MPRTIRGGQARYSPLAILTALTLKAVFRLALRPTDGLIGSIINLLGLNLAVPTFCTLSRQAETMEVPRSRANSGADNELLHRLVDSTGLKLCGAGQWLVEKHGTRRRRSWRKLHIGVDASTGQIVDATLTTKDVDDASEVGPLLEQLEGLLASVTADGAYDQDNVYDAVTARDPEAAVVVPPRSTDALSETAEIEPTRRDRHLAMIAEQGRMAWQVTTGYGQRSLVETTMGCDKTLIGARLRAHGFAAQRTEAAIGVAVLNRMLVAGRPDAVHCQRVIGEQIGV